VFGWTRRQARSGFGYGTRSIRRVQRNLLFTVGAQLDRVFDGWWTAPVRLDVPICGPCSAPSSARRYGTPTVLKLAAVIETPRFDLTLFKLHFGSLS